jgi:hypothetical protein
MALQTKNEGRRGPSTEKHGSFESRTADGNTASTVGCDKRAEVSQQELQHGAKKAERITAASRFDLDGARQGAPKPVNPPTRGCGGNSAEDAGATEKHGQKKAASIPGQKASCTKA